MPPLPEMSPTFKFIIALVGFLITVGGVAWKADQYFIDKEELQSHEDSVYLYIVTTELTYAIKTCATLQEQLQHLASEDRWIIQIKYNACKDRERELRAKKRKLEE